MKTTIVVAAEARIEAEDIYNDYLQSQMESSYESNEDEFDKIEALNISELCRLSEYYTDNEHKLMKAYNQITFDVDGMKQVFCAIVNRDRIVINPRIFYRGHDPQQAYDAIYNKI